MSGESGGDAKLSVRAAARLWDVTRSTVHEWRTTGRVRIFRMGAHGFETTLAEVRAAKVLLESSILQGPVTEHDLANAHLRTTIPACMHDSAGPIRISM
jgi:hypothetical protein